MHEYSIVSSLIDVCKEIALQQNAKTIGKIVLKVGRLSGIELHFLTSCFDVFKEDTLCRNSELAIEICEVSIVCEECMSHSIIYENNFFCPVCKSHNTKMISGQELLVKSIEIESSID